MDPAHWERLQRLFHQAMELEPDQREPFIAEHAAGDEDLARQLRALVAEASTVDPLEEEVGKVAADLAGVSGRGSPAAPESVEGTTIGAYRALRLIGQGGMGAVYLADRADEAFDKQVAVKLLARAGADAARRFVGERQILASIEHPNIARLIDGGETDDGVPFVVMEYVDGLPIDEYCARHDLGVPARLELFLEVCEAVQYAHRNLIVHRDIKPGNILVTPDGTPKLLDFGIAKLLDPASSTITDHTATSVRVMTPDYASPEQVRGEPVTIASDVYSLGVLFYRLLTGERPYRLDSDSLGDLERAITGQEPRRPSRVRSELSGDLDAIALMALRKEPGHRYASVEHFAEDVRRCLDGRPVEARTGTWRYRAGKFVRRHRLAVAASAVFVTALIAFGAVMTVQSVHLARERDESERQRQTATDALEFLVGLFDEADPTVARGEQPTAKKILDRGRERIRSEMTDRPRSRARLVGVMGNVYFELGEYDTSRELLEEAIALREPFEEEEPDELVAVLLDYTRTLMELGLPYDAEPYAERALAISERVRADGEEPMWQAYSQLCFIRGVGEMYDKAEPVCVRAVELLTPRKDEDPVNYTSTTMGLANIYLNTDRLDEALALYREAERLLVEAEGEDHPWVGTLVNNIGLVHMYKGDFDEAQTHLHRALEFKRSVLPPDHPQIGHQLSTIGLCHDRAGELDEAIRYYHEALALFDGTTAQPGQIWLWLGLVHQRREDFPATLNAMENSLAYRKDFLPPTDPDLAWSYNNVGWSLILVERYEDAVAHFNESIATLRAHHDEDPVVMVSMLWGAGNALARLGRYDEADVRHAEALAAPFDDPPALIYDRGCTWALAGDDERALEYLAAAIEAGFEGDPAADTDYELLWDDPRFLELVQ